MTPTQRMMNQLSGICDSISQFESALLNLLSYPPRAADIATLSEDERLAMCDRIAAAKKKLVNINVNLGIVSKRLSAAETQSAPGDDGTAPENPGDGEAPAGTGENPAGQGETPPPPATEKPKTGKSKKSKSKKG